MPTLEEYREPVLSQIGGFQSGYVDLGPDINDQDAARALISQKLFDREKTSDAFGGQYLWIPRWSDNRRVESRGYSVKYVAVFEPPSSGTYKLQFFGFGETRPISSAATAASVQAAIGAVGGADLSLVTVDSEAGSPYLNIRLPFEIGVGATGGRLVAQGGLGVLLASQGYSQPLARGLKWYLSPKIPFVSADGVTGIHDCINLALSDIYVPRLLPVTGLGDPSSRARVLNPRELAPWLTRDLIYGYYGPTDHRLVAVFVPPSSGTYRLSLGLETTYGPTSSALAHDASGAQVEAALNGIAGIVGAAVSPQSAAPSYVVTYHTRYYNPSLIPTAGYVTAASVDKLREPYPLVVSPYYQQDAEVPTLSDPGLPAGETWYIAVRGPANGRVAPQSYPRRADGALDATRPPIKGSAWIETTGGLANDLDQAFPPVGEVTDRAIRYVLAAIEDASAAGEAGPWAAAGRMAAAQAVARSIYGPVRRRPSNVQRYIGSGVSKGADYWLP